MSPINFISLNIQRLQTPNAFDLKITQLLHHHNTQCTIYSLQEARCSQSKLDQFNLRNPHLGDLVMIGSAPNEAKIIAPADWILREEPILIQNPDIYDNITTVLLKVPFTRKKILLINAYFPVASYQQRILLLQSIQEALDTFNSTEANTETIICGDFNMVLGAEDTSNPTTYKPNEPSAQVFNQFVTENQLQDMLKYAQPGTERFTNNVHYTNTLAKRRIDYLFTSPFLCKYHISYTNTNSGISTSHNMIKISITTSGSDSANSKFAPSRFRLTPTLFQDPKLQEYATPLLNEKDFPSNTGPNEKMNIFDRLWNHTVVFLEKSQQAIRVFKRKTEPMVLNLMETQAQVPHEIPYLNYYQLKKLFKKSQTESTIQQLQDPATGEIIDSTYEILQVMNGYYKSLFNNEQEPRSYREPEMHNLNFFSSMQNKITESQKEKLAAPVTKEEIDAALKVLYKKKTSPGLDGIPYSYYHHHSEVLSPILAMVANTMMSTGRLPHTMMKVIIKLLPKEGKDPLSIENYRPISLLNTNLKIISSVVNNRLLPVASSVIDSTQVGFLPGRQMDNLLLQMFQIVAHFSTHYSPLVFRGDPIFKQDLRDEISKERSLMVQLDMTKAFDKVQHRYILHSLAKYGLPQSLINIISAITTQQIAYLMANNHLSEPILLKSGVRQGNPVSPTIFVMVLEPLTEAIRKCIDGISLRSFFNTHKIKTLSYADDVTVFIGSQKDAKNLMILLASFTQVSGLKINESKSKVWLLSDHSNWRGSEEYYKIYGPILPFPPLHITLTSEKYLGIPLDGVNWSMLCKQLVQNIRYPLIQHLPIRVRALSISIYTLSRIYFRDIHSPIPEGVMKSITKAIDEQIRGVSYDTLVTPAVYGGFSLQDLPVQLEGKRAKMVYLLFFNNDLPFFTIIRERLQYIALELTLLLSLGPPYQAPESLYYLMTKKSYTFETMAWYNLLDSTFIHYLNQEKRNPSSKVNQVFNFEKIEGDVTLYSFFTKIIHTAKFDSKVYYNHMDLQMKRFFQPNQLTWFKAFEATTYSKDVPKSLTILHKSRAELYHLCHDQLETAQQSLHLHLQDIDGSPINLQSFLHFNKKQKKQSKSIIERYPPYAPSLLNNSQGKEQWQQFWSKAYKFQTKSPGSLEPLHFFNLGHYDHQYHFPDAQLEDLPRLRLPYCSLCQDQDSRETIPHLFQDCPISKQLWELVTNSTTPITIAQMVAPHKATKAQMLNMSHYIDVVWYLRKKRRRLKEAPTADFPHVKNDAIRFLHLKRSPTRYYTDQL